MATMTLTLIGMYNYYDSNDPTTGLFYDFSVPEDTFDKGTLVNDILLLGGDYEVIYSDGDLLKQMIKLWADKNANTMTRIWTALHSEYNPIENYDRQEDWTDDNTGSTSESTSGTLEHDVSAFNSGTYSHESKDTSSGTTGTSLTGQGKHKGHVHGNIGVTTSQQMIESELSLYADYNAYDTIARLFLHDFVIPI